jgi:hypothetical protein
MAKQCTSCGMPMGKPEDYPGGDTAKDWCVHCATSDGELKSYEETLIGMTTFMTASQGIAKEAAREAAKTYMKTMPAWKDVG